MATNEILESLRESERLKETREIYESMKSLFQGTPQANALDELIKKKFDTPDSKTKVTCGIKFDYADETVDDFFFDLRKRDIIWEEDVHFKMEDNVYFKNTNKKSIPFNPLVPYRSHMIDGFKWTPKL